MAPKAVRSAIALALCTLIFGISAIDSEAAEGTGKASPELPPWAFKVFSKDGSESSLLIAHPRILIKKDTYRLKLLAGLSTYDFSPPVLRVLTLPQYIEEVLNKHPTTADESRKARKIRGRRWRRISVALQKCSVQEVERKSSNLKLLHWIQLLPENGLSPT